MLARFEFEDLGRPRFLTSRLPVPDLSVFRVLDEKRQTTNPVCHH